MLNKDIARQCDTVHNSMLFLKNNIDSGKLTMDVGFLGGRKVVVNIGEGEAGVKTKTCSLNDLIKHIDKLALKETNTAENPESIRNDVAAIIESLNKLNSIGNEVLNSPKTSKLARVLTKIRRILRGKFKIDSLIPYASAAQTVKKEDRKEQNVLNNMDSTNQTPDSLSNFVPPPPPLGGPPPPGGLPPPSGSTSRTRVKGFGGNGNTQKDISSPAGGASLVQQPSSANAPAASTSSSGVKQPASLVQPQPVQPQAPTSTQAPASAPTASGTQQTTPLAQTRPIQPPAPATSETQQTTPLVQLRPVQPQASAQTQPPAPTASGTQQTTPLAQTRPIQPPVPIASGASQQVRPAQPQPPAPTASGTQQTTPLAQTRPIQPPVPIASGASQQVRPAQPQPPTGPLQPTKDNGFGVYLYDTPNIESRDATDYFDAETLRDFKQTRNQLLQSYLDQGQNFKPKEPPNNPEYFTGTLSPAVVKNWASNPAKARNGRTDLLVQTQAKLNEIRGKLREALDFNSPKLKAKKNDFNYKKGIVEQYLNIDEPLFLRTLSYLKMLSDIDPF